MHISTSYNKGISATTRVQCAAACKWLQPGSGLVDAFLTGQVDACVNLPRDAPTLGESSCRELPRTPQDVRPFSKATPRKTNQRGKNRSRSMILTDTPVINALKAEASKVKRTTGCTVARMFVPKKELQSTKRQKDTEEETCQCLVSVEPFGNRRPGEKWVSCAESGKWPHENCTSEDRC